MLREDDPVLSSFLASSTTSGTSSSSDSSGRKLIMAMISYWVFCMTSLLIHAYGLCGEWIDCLIVYIVSLALFIIIITIIISYHYNEMIFYRHKIFNMNKSKSKD